MTWTKWMTMAKTLGFDEVQVLKPALLRPRQDIRDMCASDRCRTYGKNWGCPPYCGTLEECGRKLGSYSGGLLLQTVGKLQKDVDTRGYRQTEQRHLEQFYRLCKKVRQADPRALCLGSGGCRICESCAWPEECRFPELVCGSMEGYGLFVTQVCRDHGMLYHHGARTVTYTACILFDGNAEKMTTDS